MRKQMTEKEKNIARLKREAEQKRFEALTPEQQAAEKAAKYALRIKFMATVSMDGKIINITLDTRKAAISVRDAFDKQGYATGILMVKPLK